MSLSRQGWISRYLPCFGENWCIHLLPWCDHLSTRMDGVACNTLHALISQFAFPGHKRCSATSAALSQPCDFHRAYDAPHRDDALVRLIRMQATLWFSTMPRSTTISGSVALMIHRHGEGGYNSACREVQAAMWEIECWWDVQTLDERWIVWCSGASDLDTEPVPSLVADPQAGTGGGVSQHRVEAGRGWGIAHHAWLLKRLLKSYTCHT